MSGRFQRIDEFHAWISSDEDGEGLIGHMTPTGWLPLIGADRERIESLRGLAQQTADASGVEVRLVSFSVRTDVETLTPQSTGNGRTIIFDGVEPHERKTNLKAVQEDE